MADIDKIKQLESRISALEKERDFFRDKSEEYENGDLSLYYSVQKKMKELSKILNKHNLGDLDIDDAKNKSFDRISTILEKCEKYALSANALGARLGVPNSNEEKPVEEVKVLRISPETMADNIGELAGGKRN